MNDRVVARKRLKNRVSRISGQINGIARMIEEDQYCLDILTQIAAARSALDQLGVQMLTDHIQTCVVGHGSESEHPCARHSSQGELVDEVRKALRQYLKLGEEYSPAAYARKKARKAVKEGMENDERDETGVPGD